MHGGVKPADECHGIRAFRCRNGVDPVRAKPLQHPLVEPDLEVLAVDSFAAKPLDEVGERGRDQVEPPQQLDSWRAARNLADNEPTVCAEGVQLLPPEEPEVLDVDHVWAERVDLRLGDSAKHVRPRRGPEPGRQHSCQSQQPFLPVFPRPGRLQLEAVDDEVDGFMAELGEVVRVGVRRAEAALHERGELLVVACTP